MRALQLFLSSVSSRWIYRGVNRRVYGNVLVRDLQLEACQGEKHYLSSGGGVVHSTGHGQQRDPASPRRSAHSQLCRLVCP
ncbi:hypothetical protein AAFF_G00128970 [Aldrovandia affinis]|uniref:Uncharacterized protein n=1 Tax=Aldrovandia affinis TaxID=143900 RepID=A0AAD7T1C8_9TELE|nr:hypothetical protein AAFF_G00128970 [Aldrovandia affinis]